MPEHLLSIRALDSLLFRDGRPFSNEVGALSADSLALPLPGTLAGLLRTHLGNAAGWQWDETASKKALQIAVAGPLLTRKRDDKEPEVMFPAPADAIHYEDKDGELQLMTLRPGSGGCNLPDGLRPLAVTQEMKPKGNYRYWPWARMQEWLLNADGQEFLPLKEEIAGLPDEERTHVKIDPAKGGGEEGMLFRTQFRAFEQHQWKKLGVTEDRSDQWALLARMTTEENASLKGVSPFGGERRLAEISTGANWPKCPDKLKASLAGAKQIRLVLATPALFKDGWKPGWLDNNLTGSLAGVSLKLVSAAVGRREPVSGWDFQARGPKAVRWMAPAGSVYFFDVTGGDASALAEQCWLQSVSDAEQDQRDGYSLALWGLWREGETTR